MTYRKQALLLMLVSAVVIIWGVQFAVSCPSNDSVCIVGHGAIAQPSVLFSVSLLITCLALFFVREDVFKSWRKFAYFAIPISIILLWLAPTTTPGGFGISYLNYTKEFASWWVSGLFLLISLIIIARKSLRSSTPR
ncbi:MAG TPA: hypothetical protein VJB98_00970 [Candidatus Paceibacterota bacterium]